VDNTPGDKLGVWRDMRLADALVFILIHVCCFSTYEGDVVSGMRHGVGVLHSVSFGITYSGDWVLGKQHGKVSVLYASVISVLQVHHVSLQKLNKCERRR